MRKGGQEVPEEANSREDNVPDRPYAFYLVALAITLALIAFVSIMLIFRAQVSGGEVTGALGSLFGVIGAVVGTYFGIKSSGDAQRERAHVQRRIDEFTSTANRRAQQ